MKEVFLVKVYGRWIEFWFRPRDYMRKIFDEFGVEYKVSKKRFRGCKLVNFREIKLSRYKIVGRDCVYMFLFTSNIIEKC